MVVGGRWSGWLWDRGDVGEDRGDCGCPWPGLGDFQSSATLAVDQSGRYVPQTVAQGLRFTQGEHFGVAGESEESGPCNQVGGEHDRGQPGLVDFELS